MTWTDSSSAVKGFCCWTFSFYEISEISVSTIWMHKQPTRRLISDVLTFAWMLIWYSRFLLLRKIYKISLPFFFMLHWSIEVEERHWNRRFSEFFGFPLRIIIPPMLHTRTPPTLKECDSPDQAASYFQSFISSSLSRHLTGLCQKVCFLANTELRWLWEKMSLYNEPPPAFGRKMLSINTWRRICRSRIDVFSVFVTPLLWQL